MLCLQLVLTRVSIAHLVRGAASSAATQAGMSTADILECADWAAVLTLMGFYLRDLQNENASERVGRVLSDHSPCYSSWCFI